jgi:hypothetical protein
VKFKASFCHLVTAKSAALCTNNMTQFRRFLWNVNPSQVGITSPLLTKPVFLDAPHIIIGRSMSCCVAKKFEIKDSA